MAVQCIINVATGKYVPYQRRLAHSLELVKYMGKQIFWNNRYPKGSPTHKRVPYGFKMHAIAEAIQVGFKTILWCDSSVWFIRHPQALFERIEQEGHLFFIGGDKLFNWTSEDCLNVFEETRDTLEAKQWQLLGGTVYGFDMTNVATQEFWRQWYHYYDGGLFHGAYVNNAHSIPDDVKVAKAGKPMSYVSADHRCFGHRHDETVASFLAYRLGMKLTGLGDLFQGYQREDNTNAVARSGYGG